MTFPTETEQIILSFVWDHKISQIDKAILKKNKARHTILPNFKLYYKAIVVNPIWYWHKYRHTTQWNKRKILGINPCIYWFTTEEPRIYNEERIVSSINSAGKTGQPHTKE